MKKTKGKLLLDKETVRRLADGDLRHAGGAWGTLVCTLVTRYYPCDTNDPCPHTADRKNSCWITHCYASA